MTLDKSARRVRTMFGQIAHRYDFLNHFLSAGTDVYWRWRTARSIPNDLAGPILDVCTGTGDLAITLHRRCRGNVQIVATDFTHEMLVIAGEKARQLTGHSIVFLESDTQTLPFADDSFELVTVAFGLRNVADTARGLREMSRVCRPGGQVFVLEFSQPEVPILGSIYGWYFRNVLPRIGQIIARNQQSAYEYLPESVGHFPYGKALVDMMESNGLEQVRFQRLTLGVATLYRGRKPLSFADRPVKTEAKLAGAIAQ